MFNGMKYVYEVYKERSFSNAARNLYISQPALSRSMQRLNLMPSHNSLSAG